MNKLLASLLCCACLVPVFSVAQVPSEQDKPEQKPENLTPADVVGLAAAVAVLGATTVDATLGEVLVRAYPSKSISKAIYPDLQSALELSCDTYRSGTANHYIATADWCHIKYVFVAKTGAKTVTGPFKPVQSFEGRSCSAARKVCGASQVTLTQKGKSVELREKTKLLGTISFSGPAPLYTPAK
jgi:hypothetical protein